ncbi:polysaccharide biosynthesis C-terminal domain-containing protein [Luedemannella helvata]|uniref:O-antigen/teichoic acid export membrane protein n=1 Tax=Luedemannella helvata TaxID=349315 RepID=A0ABN2JQ11_9ACTN
MAATLGSLQKVARGGVANLAGAVAATTMGVLVTWLAARALPPPRAGALFAALAAFVLVSTVAKLGTQTGLVYWIARLRALDQAHLLRRCLWLAIAPVVAASVVAGAGLFLGAAPLARLADPGNPGEFATAVRVLAGFLPLAVATDTLLAATRGLHSVRATVVVDKLLRPGLQLAGFAALAVLLVEPDLMPFALAMVLPYAPAAALAGLALRRRVRGLPPASPSPGLPLSAPPSPGLGRDFWRFTAPRAVAGVLQTALQRVDVLLVATFAGVRAAAVYAVAGRFVVVGQFANQAIAQTVQSRLAEAVALRDRGATATLYQGATAWLVLLVWPVHLLTAVFAPVYLGLFGDGYRAGVPVVAVLAAAMLVASACGTVDSVLAMAGRTSWNLYNVAAALAVMIVLDVLLIPPLGALGAALGLAAAVLLNNLVPIVQVGRLVGVHPFGAGTVTACAAAVTCFGVLPMVSLAAPPPWRGFAALALVALGIAGYAAACWRFRGVLGLTALRRRHDEKPRRGNMREDYTRIFQNLTAVEKYEEVVYAPDTYSSAVNRRQRAYLRSLVARAFPQRRPVQHDFACGTGRAIRILHGLVRDAHGYDTSAAMLERARASGVFAHLHQVPESGRLPRPMGDGAPALVTVFRLLLNVGDDVRDRAIGFAASLLPHSCSGLLVIENHGNRTSVRHLRHRRRAGDPWFNELSHAEVDLLLARHGFTVVERRGFAVCPPGAYARRWLRPVARLVDGLAWRIPALAGVATTVLYVARRTGGPDLDLATAPAAPAVTDLPELS